MNIGLTLREARERRGLSLDQLAQVTKIRVVTLEAIEAGETDRIPEIFLRGFLRALAREVGLDPDDIISQHLAALDEAAEAREPVPSAPAIDADPHEAERRQVRRDLQIAVAMLAVGAAAYYATASWRSPSSAPEPSADVAQIEELARSSTAPGSPAPAAEADGLAASRASDVAPATIGNDLVRLRISARAPCWLSATIDGRLVAYHLMQPGGQHTFDVQHQAVLRVGDPAAIEWSLNGQPGRPLGLAGEAVTVHITPQNHLDFVQSAPLL